MDGPLEHKSIYLSALKEKKSEKGNANRQIDIYPT